VAGDVTAARAKVPPSAPYPLPANLEATIGAAENSREGEMNVCEVAGTRPVACNSSKFALLIVR
jgi:hypothetical protein